MFRSWANADSTGGGPDVTLRSLRPARLVVAVPVAPAETCEALRDVADEVVCLRMPEPFHAVGVWYADFAQTLDNEVRELLEQARSTA